MDQSTDRIVVTAKHEEDVSADGVEVLVTVQGSALVTGRAALTKAKEVSRLVEELAKCGLAPADITLMGVHAEVTSGFLGRSSSATYRLRVRCSNLEHLPDVLGAVTSAKNAQLEGLAWQYPDSPEQQAQWLRICVQQTNLKAQAVAEALGARLVGIHSLSEQPLHEREGRPVPFDGAAPPGARARLDLGFELTQRKKAGLRIVAEYRVAGFRGPGAQTT